MADQAPAPKAPKTITMKCGRVCVLHELSMMDFQDGIEILKTPVDNWISRAPDPKHPEDPDKHQITINEPYKTIPTLIWLMSRKDGLTRDEIIQRKWKFKLADIEIDMHSDDLSAHGWTVVSCFYGVEAIAGG
jgi:hypothetical protein